MKSGKKISDMQFLVLKQMFSPFTETTREVRKYRAPSTREIIKDVLNAKPGIQTAIKATNLVIGSAQMKKGEDTSLVRDLQKSLDETAIQKGVLGDLSSAYDVGRKIGDALFNGNLRDLLPDSTPSRKPVNDEEKASKKPIDFASLYDILSQRGERTCPICSKLSGSVQKNLGHISAEHERRKQKDYFAKIAPEVDQELRQNSRYGSGDRERVDSRLRQLSEAEFTINSQFNAEDRSTQHSLPKIRTYEDNSLQSKTVIGFTPDSMPRRRGRQATQEETGSVASYIEV